MLMFSNAIKGTKTNKFYVQIVHKHAWISIYWAIAHLVLVMQMIRLSDEVG